MNQEAYRKGILYSLMWSLAYQLNKQYPNTPSRKIKGIIYRCYDSYSEDKKQIFHDLRVKIWEKLEDRYLGDVNLPVMMTELYWAFPNLFGKKIQEWIDKMDDLMVSHIPNDESIDTSKDVASWYIELIDKEIFDYIKQKKRGNNECI